MNTHNKKPLVSLFLVTYNRKDVVLETISKLYEQSYRPIEIIVTDNNSIDNTAEAIESQFPEVKLIRSDKNLGAVVGRNTACKMAKGKYVVSFDDDSFPGTHCISRMVDRFESNQELGLICFNVYNYNSFIKNYYDEAHLPSQKTRDECYFWSGCGGGYRHSVVKELGLWEEWGNTPPFELAISAKVVSLGMKGINFSDIYVFHVFSSISSKHKKEENYNKWSYPVEKPSSGHRICQNVYYSMARNTLLYTIKFYPINFQTLIWVIKYTWAISNGTIQSKRMSLIKAMLVGWSKIFHIRHERIPLTQEQLDRVGKIGFNFRGK
ncbi:glycosyltransferase family 2 protein [Candidatus Kuenenbacteria bacterium]|nr:glycosyltransferase family 2 protein [Candidatus Kuenenbacteria bacterium]